MAFLKQRAEQTDHRLHHMEGKLDQIVDVLRSIATKEDVREAKRAAWQALGTGAAIAFGVVAISVAVVAYLQDQHIAARPGPPAASAPPAPVIQQLPPWPAAPLPPPQPPAN